MEQSPVPTHLQDPQAFITRYVEVTWAVRHTSDRDDARIRDALYMSIRQFPIAFEVVFGRAPTRLELDLADLAREESLYAWLRARGRGENGHPIDRAWPGSLDMRKLRRKLGRPGGVKNRAEYDELFLLMRKTRDRIRARLALGLGRPFREEDEATVDRIVDLELGFVGGEHDEG